MEESTLKLVVWIVVALAIDSFVDPTFNWIVHSVVSDRDIATWNPAVQVLCLHLVPFGFSNFFETLAYLWLKEKQIL